MPGRAKLSRGPSSGPDTHAIESLPSIDIEAHTLANIAADLEPRWGRFLRHWQTAADKAGGIPSRAAIDPAGLGKTLIPNIFLVDVVRESESPDPRFRFRFRLLGEEIVERESTRVGTYLDQFQSGYQVAEMQRQYRDCLDGKVRLRTASLAWNNKDYLEYQVLLLPLSDDGRKVTHFIGLAIYQS